PYSVSYWRARVSPRSSSTNNRRASCRDVTSESAHATRAASRRRLTRITVVTPHSRDRLPAVRPIGGQRRIGPFGHAQDGAPRTRVAPDFFDRRLLRPPYFAQRRFGQRRRTEWQSRDARIAAERLRRERNEALDDAILERMKADD